MNHTKYILLLAACLCIAGSCKKEEDDNRHRDIFRCEINDVLWEAKCIDEPLFGCSAVDCQYYENTGFLELVAYNDLGDENTGFHIVKKSTGGGLVLGNNEMDIIEIFINNEKFDSIINSNFIVNSIDHSNKIIEGVFNCTVKAGESSIASITQGYFKVKYRP